MRRDLTNSALAILVFTVLLGLAYPLATTGVAQVLWPNKADGSVIERDGEAVGSRLIGQDFSEAAAALLPVAPLGHRLQPGRHLLQQPRPELQGPEGAVRGEPRRLPEARAALQPGARSGDVPPDAVQTTASGVDPHISKENAEIQARRVAEERGLDLERVLELVDENTDDRGLGVLGEPGVNVLELNLALDDEEGSR